MLEYKVGKDPDCDLITVGKWYAMTGYGVGFPRGSSYIEEVNKILLELQHNGKRLCLCVRGIHKLKKNHKSLGLLVMIY